MINNIINKIYIYEINSKQPKLIHTYRYLSWFFTSVFYFWGNPTSHWAFKLGVIFLIYISARIIVGAYNKYDSNIKIERTFIFVETIGIILILLPTGGLNSPFIWYALNPVLISASFSLYYFCWFNLACYLSISTIISYFYFNPDKDNLNNMISKHSHLILIFILITLVVQLLTSLTKILKKQSNELLKVNTQLNQANKSTKESIEHIMSLYQTVEAFTSQDNKENIYQIFTNYTVKLTRADSAFFWLGSGEKEQDKIFISGTMTQEIKQNLIRNIEGIWKENLLLDDRIKICICDNKFIAVIVKSISSNYGLIGIRTDNCESGNIKKEYVKQLEFISELIAVILERFHLEEVTERLMIAEEQNRIANEMHDSVAQRLFGISCAVHTIIASWGNMSKYQLQEKLYTLQNSAHSAMKELRSTIYKLSSRKGGQNSFQSDIKEYLDNISKLTSVIIKLKIVGDDEMIDITKKRGIYRIICEATGNAIRHGKCSLIMINLDMENEFTKLNITDNGEGFVFNNISSGKDSGLGLQNMKRIAESLNSEIEINSELGCGTEINIIMPNNVRYYQPNQGGFKIYESNNC